MRNVPSEIWLLIGDTDAEDFDALNSQDVLWYGGQQEPGDIQYLHADFVRAWQAFRDWLNGTPEQWREYCEQHFIDGQLEILLGGKGTKEARRQLDVLTRDML